MPGFPTPPENSELPAQPDLVVAVLAGGQSRRMGHDKARLNFNGVEILQRVCEAALNAGLPVVVVGRRPEDLPQALRDRVSAVPDDNRGQGPLEGLATALRFTRGDIIAISCDVPLLNEQDFIWLSKQTDSAPLNTGHGIITRWEDEPQPLFALYRQKALPLIEELLANGNHAMKALFVGDFCYVSIPVEHCGAVCDVDTPYDLHSLMVNSEHRR